MRHRKTKNVPPLKTQTTQTPQPTAIATLQTAPATPTDHCDHRVLCLRLPNWPIQRLVVERPELKFTRVVLFREDSRRGRLVAAASPLAERDGVCIEMPIAEAKSLLKRSVNSAKRTARNPTQQNKSRSTNFYILPHDPTTDLHTIQQLADRLDTFSPLVGLETDTDRPDSIFLDITGLAHLFGSQEKLVERVQQFCQQQGYVSQTAIADTVGLAWGMVRCASQYKSKEHQSKVQASDLPARNAHSLALRACIDGSDLPIESLRLKPSTIETLHQLGLHSVGQLFKLPRRDLTARFGNEICRRLDQMSGATPEPIIARRPPPEYYVQQLLDAPTPHRETIEAIIRRLTEQICRELSATGRGALQWTFRLFHNTPLPIKFHVSLFQPTATPDHVMQLALMQLEQALRIQPAETTAHATTTQLNGKALAVGSKHKPRHNNPRHRKKKKSFIRFGSQRLEVHEITVSVTSSVLLAHRQRKLFDENPRLDRQSLAHLINRLSGRLGRHNVVYPTLNSGAQPEYAFQLRPLINPHRRTPRRTDNTRSQPSSHVMARPLQMFNPPIEIHAEHRLGRAQELLNVRFTSNSNQHSEFRITQSWGPERIETGWWRGRTACRNYWRVATESGNQFWIYQDLRTKKWFLQGGF